MPRLFDLLSDSTKKELITESKKQPQKKPQDSTVPKITIKKVHSIKLPDFVALDVETTGLDFKNDRIIEIGAVKFRNGLPEESIALFVNPGIPIPPMISDLTGITQKDVADAPEFRLVADKILEFIGNLPFCGHQIEFDASFLKEELRRIGKPATENPFIDTALLSRLLLDSKERFSLKHVCGVVGITLDNAHRALHDARASGEIAVKLIPKIAELPLNVRQTIAACAPASLVKQFFFESITGYRPQVLLECAREKQLPRLAGSEVVVEISAADTAAIFAAGGKMSQILDAYTPRESQGKMAKGVSDALSTTTLYAAEAGTGTGKSLAYLVPAALWSLANNRRVIIATRTRNLQDQLMDKDVPVARSVTDVNLTVSLLKGRSNYLCQHRFAELLLGRHGNLSPRERFAILPLVVWANRTLTGDIEDQNQFNPKWFAKIWNNISAEHHECGHRRCQYFSSCFFQKARNKALGSHIVIINHALFFSDICSGASFLGLDGPIIFDEAHHLEAGGHRFLRVELDTNRMNLFFEIVNNCVQHTGNFKEEKHLYDCGKELRNILKTLRKASGDFSSAITQWAKKQFETVNDYQSAYGEGFVNGFQEAVQFLQVITSVYESLLGLKQAVRETGKVEGIDVIEHEVQACVEHAAQLKADFTYLSSALTDDHVFWVEGNHDKGWTKLCGVPLDIGSLLSQMWERTGHSVVFTSATLAVAGSFDYFKRGIGLDYHSARTAEACFKSPFSSGQAIGCVLKNAPEPDAAHFPKYVAEAITALHTSFGKNILVLFTANAMLSSVYQELRENPAVTKSSLLAQGMSGSRQIILDEFKKNQRMILLGTDSFWEGVDVPGEACEIVIIPRLPFPVPSHPLTAAISKRMQEKNGDSFFSYAVPEAIIRFRQGAGRLIRTSTDRGALVVLDNRMATRGYGKQFVKSIDTTFSVFDDLDSMVKAAGEFFSGESDTAGDDSRITYVPMDEV